MSSSTIENTAAETARVHVPTKDEEITILRDAARQLGPLSYAGPWLSQQVDGIERDLRSDFFPQIDLNATRRQCEQEAQACASLCAARVASAEKQAAEILRAARAEAERITCRAAADLRAALKDLCG